MHNLSTTFFPAGMVLEFELTFQEHKNLERNMKIQTFILFSSVLMSQKREATYFLEFLEFQRFLNGNLYLVSVTDKFKI